MLIALIGPERFLVAEALHAHLAHFAPGDDSFADLNLTRLDGSRATPDELARAVQSMAFFGDRRVVVVEGLLSRFGGRAGGDAGGREDEPGGRNASKGEPGLADAFAGVLAAVPESTVLLLVERGGASKSSALFKAAQRYGNIEEYPVLKSGALERWIGERSRKAGVRLTPGAQAELAAALPDLQALANELDKLALYAGEGGTLDEAALHEISFLARQDDVFEMTSAAARRDTKGALLQLHRLVQGGTSPEGILPVLAWQVRTLIQLRDLIDRRVPEQRMSDASGINDFVVRKSLSQARQFTMPKLMEVHGKLLELDHAVKTGRLDAGLSLDALVVEMCRG